MSILDTGRIRTLLGMTKNVKEINNLPYIQPGTNNYFGFQPVENADARPMQVNFYAVSSSEGTAILPGDMVVLTTIDTARVITGAFTGIMLGVSAGTLAANGGSTGATLTTNTSQLLPVYDSPSQLFTVCDTTSGLLGSTGLYKSVAVLATGPALTLSTAAGRSIMAISAVTASSAGGPVKIIGLHPVEGIFPSGLSTDAGSAGVAASVRKWIVQPSNHIYAALDNRGVVTS